MYLFRTSLNKSLSLIKVISVGSAFQAFIALHMCVLSFKLKCKMNYLKVIELTNLYESCINSTHFLYYLFIREQKLLLIKLT